VREERVQQGKGREGREEKEKGTDFLSSAA